MYKTIEAIYDHGKIEFPDEDIGLDRARVLITVLEEEKPKKIMRWKDIFQFSGILTSFTEDPVEYQRKLRNEW